MGKLLVLGGLLGFLMVREVDGEVGTTSSPTAFGYQGHLTAGLEVAAGLFDLRVALFDSASSGDLAATPAEHRDVPVAGGVFTVSLDFGIHLVPGKHWLEFEVRRSGGNETYRRLVPRQAIFAVPYASTAALASDTVTSRFVTSPSLPGAPSVVIAPAAESGTHLPGGIAWLDQDGDFAAGIVADSADHVRFPLNRPMHVAGAALVVGGNADAFPSPGTNALQILGASRFEGLLHADAGIRFSDGTELQSAETLRQPNVLWVSPQGNDRTAVRGNPNRPWKSIGHAISNAVSGDAVLILPGRYLVRTIPELGAKRVAAPIRVVGLTNVTIAGFGGTPEIYAPAFGDIIQVVGCYKLTFRNLQLRSDASGLSSPPHGQSAGICFRPEAPTNSRILVESCRFTGVPHAITTFAAPAVTTDHLTVRDCLFIDCGWTRGVPDLGQDGGALTGFGNHMKFVNNTLDGAIRGVEFYRFPGDPGHTNALISGNLFLNYWDCAICSFDDGPENQATLDSVVITDNLFEDAPNEVPGGELSGSAAVLINSGRRITIRGNLVNRGKLYGIKVSALTGPLEYVDITANAVSDVAGRGIQITDYGPGVRHVRVTNNRLWGNSGGGILAQGRFLDLAFNDIAGNYPAGIRITASETGVVTSDSRVYGNSLVGNANAFMIEGTTNLLVDANHVILPEIPDAEEPEDGSSTPTQEDQEGPNPSPAPTSAAEKNTRNVRPPGSSGDSLRAAREGRLRRDRALERWRLAEASVRAR